MQVSRYVGIVDRYVGMYGGRELRRFTHARRYVGSSVC